MIDPVAQAPTAIAELLEFWFLGCRDDPEAATGRLGTWFEPNPSLDHEIRERFGTWVELASDGKLAAWRGSPHGSLGLILLLDQFPPQYLPRQRARLRLRPARPGGRQRPRCDRLRSTVATRKNLRAPPVYPLREPQRARYRSGSLRSVPRNSGRELEAARCQFTPIRLSSTTP